MIPGLRSVEVSGVGNKRKSNKPTKRNRVSVLFDVETTLDNYCRVCPYIGGNTQNKNCKSCPVDWQLREYGKELGWDQSTRNQNAPLPWTAEEDLYLRNSFGKITATKMTVELKRSYNSVTKRIRKLREEGLI